jgi:hypothetical protein
MSNGLRLDNLSLLGQKYPISSNIRISIVYNIKFSHVCVTVTSLLKC